MTEDRGRSKALGSGTGGLRAHDVIVNGGLPQGTEMSRARGLVLDPVTLGLEAEMQMGRPLMSPLGALFVVCGLLLVSAPSPARAQSSEPPAQARVPDWNTAPPPATQSDLAIVVGGGVSLGAYQGGYLYALGEELKRRGVRPALYVGASAGTINALLLGIEMCHPSVQDPQNSPLRSVWMDASLAKLRQGKTTSPTAVFPQDGVRSIAQLARSRLTTGIDGDCDFVLAGETSRVRPRPVQVAENQTVPDLQEPFTIRITVNHGVLHIQNYVAEDDASPARALLPFPRNQTDADGQKTALDLLIELVLASSAFPAAFPQVDLPHCMTDPNHREAQKVGTTECGSLAVYTTTSFADGGVLDNTPVGLAIETARGGWAPDARHWGQARTPDPEKDRPRGLSYLLVDTDNDVFDPLPTQSQPLDSFVSFAATFGSGFLEAARGRELYDTLQQYPELKRHLAVSQLHTRLASHYLFDFFGFFDARLRDFDFTGGMYDAAQLIASGRLAALLGEGTKAEPERADVAGVAKLAALEGSTLRWKKLACMAQAYGPPRAPGDYDRCAPLPGPALDPDPWQPIGDLDVELDFESFVDIVQASLDELYSQCTCASALSQRPLGEACAALLQASTTPPRIRGSDPLDRGWQQQCKAADGGGALKSVENPLDYAERRLARYGFAGASAQETKDIVRARVGTLADDAIARQPFWDRVGASLAGSIAADTEFGYAPALHSVHFVGGLGGLELEYSYGSRLRVAAAVQLKGLLSQSVAATPLGGIDWNVPFPSSIVHPHLFGRIGFQFGSTAADDVSSSCWGGFGGHAENCIVGQLGAALTLLELLRLQGIWEESSAPVGNAINHVLVELGFQANWPIGPR